MFVCFVKIILGSTLTAYSMIRVKTHVRYYTGRGRTANMAGCLRAFTSSSAVSATVWKSLFRGYPGATVYGAAFTRE